MAETMLPAAPVTTTTVSGPSRMPTRSSPNGSSDSATVHRVPSSTCPTSTQPGVTSRLGNEQLGEPVGVETERYVDDLHERAGLLTVVGLGEAAHGATERGGCAVLVVAVVATEPGGRDQERRGS